MISRQKLIEELNIIEKFYLHDDNEICSMSGHECYPQDECPLCMLERMRNFINSQPPADRWIPCSEWLPDTEEEVWVILGYTYESDYTQKSIARYIIFENGEAHWCDNKWGYLEWDKYSDGHGGCSSYKVIAWMPAKPYKGVE